MREVVRKHYLGQLMVEILVGLGVITVALVTSMVVVTHATKLSRVTRNRLEAGKFAELVLENYRNLRDSDSASFFTNNTCSDPCGTSGPNGMYSCRMTCNFTPAGPTASRVDVTVTVTWDDAGTQTVSVPTVLTLYNL